jgi:hypothetical protein
LTTEFVEPNEIEYYNNVNKLTSSNSDNTQNNEDNRTKENTKEQTSIEYHRKLITNETGYSYPHNDLLYPKADVLESTGGKGDEENKVPDSNKSKHKIFSTCKKGQVKINVSKVCKSKRNPKILKKCPINDFFEKEFKSIEFEKEISYESLHERWISFLKENEKIWIKLRDDFTSKLFSTFRQTVNKDKIANINKILSLPEIKNKINHAMEDPKENKNAMKNPKENKKNFDFIRKQIQTNFKNIYFRKKKIPKKLVQDEIKTDTKFRKEKKRIQLIISENQNSKKKSKK